MKYSLLLCCLPLMLSCHPAKPHRAAASTDTSGLQYQETDTPAGSLPVLTDSLRPGAQLFPAQLYRDTFRFVAYNDNGDYPLLFVSGRDKQRTDVLIRGWAESDTVGHQFNRGDEIAVAWKMDTIWIAGEGERRDWAPWAMQAVKVREGAVSRFLRSYPPLTYNYGKEERFSAEFLDELYRDAVYYLANTQQPLVLAALKDPASGLHYFIEELEFRGKPYMTLAFSTRAGAIQWLYIDRETGKCYEYDLAEDRLLPFD